MIKSAGSELDKTDRQILDILQEEGRISNAELASRIHLSPPATHGRVRRLESAGYIKGYVALLDRQITGHDNLCFVEMSLAVHERDRIRTILDRIVAMPEVLECHNVTGEYDYLLKVVVRSTQALEAFISGKLIPIEGIARIHTSLVLKEVKSTTRLALEGE